MARAFADIASDRIRELAGATLPRTAGQLARRDVVNALLRDSPGSAPLPIVRDVRLPGVTFESSNCTNFLIEVDFDAAADDLPRTLYVKIPCPELATRGFANAMGFWSVETVVCERVAPQLAIRVPRVHAVARQGSRFVLLLENLREDPTTTLFINRDMAAGTSPDRARMCLTTLAELHAHFWGWNRDRRESTLPSTLHPYLGAGGRSVTRALNAAAIAPAHRAAPEIFTDRHVAICKRAIAKWDALVDYWYGEPLTLIHGDSHLANHFEYGTPSGIRTGMLDFQGTQWCRAMRDVQYFLTYSLDPDLLASHEERLVDFYLDQLAQRGIGMDRSEAREHYRAFSLQTLMVGVISIGLGSLTERDDTVRTVLRRSVAAIDRLDFDTWLRHL